MFVKRDVIEVLSRCRPALMTLACLTACVSAFSLDSLADDSRPPADEEIITHFGKYVDLPVIEPYRSRSEELTRMALATKRGQTQGMNAIISALSHHDSRVRRIALIVLADQAKPPAAAVKPLTKILEDTTPSNRWIARKSLRSLGVTAESALPTLEKTLSQSQDESYGDILFTMCKVAPGDERVKGKFIAVAIDEDQPTGNRQLAVHCLGIIGKQDEVVIQALLGLRQRPALKWITANSLFRVAPERDPVADVAKNLIRSADSLDLTIFVREDLPLLGTSGAKLSSEFERILREEDGIRSIIAAAALLRIDRQHKSARETFIKALGGNHADVQQMAAVLICDLQVELNAPQLADALLTNVLAGPRSPRHPTFVRAIGFMGTQDRMTCEALGNLLARPSGYIKKSAALTLVKVDKERRTRLAIAGYLRQKSTYYRASTEQLLSIARAFGSVDVFVQTLTDMLSSSRHRVVGLQMLSKIGTDAGAAVPSIVDLLDDPSADSDIRQRAAELLGKVGIRARVAIPRLRELRKDRDIFVRWQAEDSMFRIESLDGGSRLRRGAAKYCSAQSVKISSSGNGRCRRMIRVDAQRSPLRRRLASFRR